LRVEGLNYLRFAATILMNYCACTTCVIPMPGPVSLGEAGGGRRVAASARMRWRLWLGGGVLSVSIGVTAAAMFCAIAFFWRDWVKH
jgi:hypothetical protein